MGWENSGNFLEAPTAQGAHGIQTLGLGTSPVTPDVAAGFYPKNPSHFSLDSLTFIHRHWKERGIQQEKSRHRHNSESVEDVGRILGKRWIWGVVTEQSHPHGEIPTLAHLHPMGML